MYQFSFSNIQSSFSIFFLSKMIISISYTYSIILFICLISYFQALFAVQKNKEHIIKCPPYSIIPSKHLFIF